MDRTTLAERLRRLEAQKARLQLAENRLRSDERKARTRRLIEAGALLEKAGLLELQSNTLYGALLALAKLATDQDRLTLWTKAGGQAFDREAKAREAGREPLTLTLPAPLSTADGTRLRGLGLRWNRLLQHWEGMARLQDVQPLAELHGGTLRRLRPPETDQRPPEVSSAA